MKDAPLSQEHETTQAIGTQNTKENNNSILAPRFIDNSPEALEQRQFQSKVDNSPETLEALEWQERINPPPRAQEATGLQENTEEVLPTKKKNNTGIPDSLKEKMEQLSGFDLSDVRVHYNSKEPAKVGAHAYAEGLNIYIASGQEKHLEHELWHVIQQLQGRVKGTMEVNGKEVNDKPALEREAGIVRRKGNVPPKRIKKKALPTSKGVVQRVKFKNNDTDNPKKVKVNRGLIIEHLHKWFIKKMKKDTLTTPPIEFNHPNKEENLNWSPLLQGGLNRRTTNTFDLYNILKESKNKSSFYLSLNHDQTSNSLSNIFSSTPLINSNDRTKKESTDGLMFPSHNLNEKDKGSGVSYKELTESFHKIAERKVDGKKRGDRNVAKAHLCLMNGNTPEKYDKSEISKMSYHLQILSLAEGRRDAGMFLFAPITLQNIADGKITGQEAFGKIETEEEIELAKDNEDRLKELKKKELTEKQKKELETLQSKNSKSKKRKEYEERVLSLEEQAELKKLTKRTNDLEGTFPASWEGSKAGLEEVETHFSEGGNIGDEKMKKGKPKKIIDKMKKQLDYFFEDRADFSKENQKDIPGANFKDKKGALIAITNLICDKFFPDVPQMRTPEEDTEKSKKNRIKLEDRKNQWEFLDLTHKNIKKLDPKDRENFRLSIEQETNELEDIRSLKRSNPEEAKKRKRKRRLKKRLNKEVDSINDELVNELMLSKTSLLGKRKTSNKEKYKKRKRTDSSSDEEFNKNHGDKARKKVKTKNSSDEEIINIKSYINGIKGEGMHEESDDSYEKGENARKAILEFVKKNGTYPKELIQKYSYSNFNISMALSGVAFNASTSK